MAIRAQSESSLPPLCSSHCAHAAIPPPALPFPLSPSLFSLSIGHPGRMAPGIFTAAVADALIVGSGIIEVQAALLPSKAHAHART